MAPNPKRRNVLKGVGAASIFGLAGCITQSPEEGGAEGDATGTETASGMDGTDDGSTDSGSTETETEDSTSSGDGRTVKLGVLMPETGDLASVGQPIRDGALLPAKQLAGEDLPVTIDTQVEDTATDPQAGIQSANALANAGYPMVTGPASSGVNLQVTQEVFIPNQIVGCSPSSTSPSVTDLDDDDYIFRTAPSDALQGAVMGQIASERLGVSDAATMYVNNDYGQKLSESFAGSFEDEYGGSVQTQVAFAKEKSSYTSELESALSDEPGLLIVIGYPASGIQIFRDYYSDFSGTETDILVTDGLRDSTLPDEVGNEMSNVTGTAPLASGPGRDFFNSAFEDEYGSAPGVFTSQAYDASAALILANVAAGENDGTAVRDNLRSVANPEGTEYGPEQLADAVNAVANGEDINYIGASSSVDFDDNGDMKAVSYEYWGFDTSAENNIKQLDTIQFGQ